MPGPTATTRWRGSQAVGVRVRQSGAGGRRNGIIAEHRRVLAARKLGMGTVPVIELGHLMEAQKRVYILADIKLAEVAGWDRELLSLELADLGGLVFDFGEIGFEEAEPDDHLSYGAADPFVSSFVWFRLAGQRYRRPNRLNRPSCASIRAPVPVELNCAFTGAFWLIPWRCGKDCTPKNWRALSAAYSAPLAPPMR